MAKSMKEILDETRNLIVTKQAEYKKSAEVGASLTGVDSMPGSERDSKSPDVKADKEVIERIPAHEKGRSAEGAGDDSKATRGHAGSIVDMPAKNQPEKKPAISADVDDDNGQKSGSSKLANDLMQSIRAYQTATKKADADEADKADKDPKHEVSETKKVEKDEHAKGVAKVAPAVVPELDAKAAAPFSMELTSDVLAKIAAMVLAEQEGVKLVQDIMAKQAGAQAANDVISFLAQQSEAAEKQAAYDQGQADADQLINQAIWEAGYKAAADQFQTKQAAPQFSAEELAYIKLGQQLADASMADAGAADAGAAGGAPGGMPPEALAAMAGGAPGAGPEAGAGGEGEVSIDDLTQALDELVQEGTISQEDAQQVIEYLSSGAGAAGEAGAPMPEAAPEAGAPSPTEAGSEEPKSEEKEEPKEAAHKPLSKLASALKARLVPVKK